MQHIKRGDFAEASCLSFHYYDNGQCHPCCCFIVSWNKTSKSVGFCLLKVGISLKSLFILELHYVAVPIYQLYFAATQRNLHSKLK